MEEQPQARNQWIEKPKLTEWKIPNDTNTPNARKQEQQHRASSQQEISSDANNNDCDCRIKWKYGKWPYERTNEKQKKKLQTKCILHREQSTRALHAE